MKTRYFIAALLSMAMWACTPENLMDDVEIDVPPTKSDAYIMISGGGTVTKAAPSLPGGCYADKLQLSFYRADAVGDQELGDLVFQSGESANIDISYKDGMNKWTTYIYNFEDVGGALIVPHNNFFAMRGLAYTDADKDLFNYNAGVNATVPELTVTVEDNAGEKSSVTPELFYGHLWFGEAKDSDGDNDDVVNGGERVNDDYWKYTRIVGKENVTVPITGTLYRIVSQVNLIISDVTEEIDTMHLLCSDFPFHINLYGDPKHGKDYYPVAAAKIAGTETAGADVWTEVATEPRRETTTLSTFLLPSEMGSELKLRIHYKNGMTKDFDVRPSSSVFLSGFSDVYTGVSDALKSGTDFYIYNNTTYRFYSYSNVRVNIRTSLDKIAAETQIVDVEIEVEPAFERKHEFPVI
jgi:hypothetical protein